MNPFKIAALVVPALVAVSVVGGSFYTVDQGYRGVVLRFGAVTGEADPGINFKAPFLDSVQEISIRDKNLVFGDNQMGGLSSFSSDQQEGFLRIGVNYQIPADKVREVYSRFGTQEAMETTAFNTNVYKAVKDAFGKYTAIRAVQERPKLAEDILNNLKAATANYPINVISVQVENIKFSHNYMDSIEKRMQAEIDVQRAQQTYNQEQIQAKIKVTQAQAIADSTLAQAKAEAESVRIRGEAEASAIKAKGDALNKNPNLVALIQAEKWNGALPTTMVPGNAVPFMNVGPQASPNQ